MSAEDDCVVRNQADLPRNRPNSDSVLVDVEDNFQQFSFFEVATLHQTKFRLYCVWMFQHISSIFGSDTGPILSRCVHTTQLKSMYSPST